MGPGAELDPRKDAQQRLTRLGRGNPPGELRLAQLRALPQRQGLKRSDVEDRPARRRQPLRRQGEAVLRAGACPRRRSGAEADQLGQLQSDAPALAPLPLQRLKRPQQGAPVA